MPKPQYEQKFRSSWLQDPLFKKWLIVIDSTKVGKQGKCKLCGTIIANRYATLKIHGLGKKHKQNEETVFGKSQQKIKLPSVDEQLKNREAEARLALYIACHTSINACDHLSNTCVKSFSDDSAAKNLHLKRTKCTNILKNVLGPHFVNDLRKDIGASPYSLIIDESTDISVLKYLGIIIIYYSKKQNRIIETFLDMPKIIECDAESLVAAIRATLQKLGLKFENLHGLGTDNASVMVGINNGVYAKLKEYVPNLVLVRYI